MYYFNARWYDQETGRFVSEDPARDGDNWYIYAGNNPLYMLDADGHEGKPFIFKMYEAYQTFKQAQARGTIDALKSTAVGLYNTVKIALPVYTAIANPVGTMMQAAYKVATDPKRTVEQVKQTVTNVTTTANNIKNNVVQTVNNLPGNVQNYVNTRANEVANGEFNNLASDYGYWSGRLTTEVGLAVATDKGLSYLGTVSKLANAERVLATQTDDVMQISNAVDMIQDTSKIGADTYAEIAKYATKRPNSTEVVLGKINNPGGKSYTEVAFDRQATSFELEPAEWDQLSNTLGRDGMWKINESFINQQWQAGKDFYFSSNPWEATGAFQKEVLQLIDIGAKDFARLGELWKVIK